MTGISGILIDLGEAREQLSAGEPAGGPAVPYRGLLGALALVLIALLGGGVPRARPITPTVLPARLGDMVFVAGDRMYLTSSSRSEFRSVVTVELPTARLIGRSTLPVPEAVTRMVAAGPALLVEYQAGSGTDWGVVAVATGSDRVLWQRTGGLLGVLPDEGLALLDTDPGTVAIEPATGRVRWTVPRPPDGYVTVAEDPDGHPAWLVTATDSGRLETRDARTGGLVAATRIDAVGRLLQPAGDVLVVDATGFRLPGLTRLWTTTADLSRSWTQSACGPVLCTFRHQRGLTVIDPDTGRELWTSDRWSYVEALGDYLLASPADREGRAWLWVLDPVSGRVLGDFGPWQGLGPSGGGRLFGKRDVDDDGAILFAELDPATRRVRVLGGGEDVSGGCQTGGGVLICRLIDASVAVWPLR